MKKNPFLKTYVAVAVAAGFGAYLYFVESKQELKPEKPKEKVFTLDKAKVKELTLAPREGEAIRLAKEGDHWTMAAPFAVPADSGEADSLVSSLASLEMDEVAAETPTRLGDFGLETPKLAIGVLLQGATEPLKLLLGDKSPDGTSLYAKIPSQPRVFTVASYIESSFTKKPFDLRDRDVLHVKRDAVKTLDVTGPEGGYSLAKSDKGEWAFTKPLSTRAGRWSVDGLLGTLENLRMESVAAEDAKDLTPFGLDKPSRSVVLGLAAGGTKTLEIGRGVADADKAKDSGKPKEKPKDKSKDAEKPPEKPAKYYVRDAGSRLVAVVPAALMDDLAKGMKELRAKRLLEVTAYDVEGFEVEADGAKRVYARSTTKDKDGIDQHKWKRTAPDAKDLDANKVQDVLFKIGGIEVADFVDTPADVAAYGLDKPALKLTIRYIPDKPALWFELGRKDGASYARRADDGSVLKLDPAKADELVKAFKEL